MVDKIRVTDSRFANKEYLEKLMSNEYRSLIEDVENIMNTEGATIEDLRRVLHKNSTDFQIIVGFVWNSTYIINLDDMMFYEIDGN